ncbi:MAG TPA: NAD-dependent epimerase/dehydratase family protein [Sporichthya sp.]|nr:NAD-dependent epimerase/dehydratase family protein [Sporichthya sp.]
MGRVVLVTGVARTLGGALVRELNGSPGVDRVIGVDVLAPRSDLGRAEFVKADIRNPIIAKVIGAAEVDTVVHLSVTSGPPGAGGRAAMKELNVIGTMQLLAACQKAPSLRRLVVKSSTAVYGASQADPAMFTEATQPKVAPRSGFAKDAAEVEAYVRGFVRRRGDVDTTVLRFASILGAGISSPITALFGLPVVPTILGYDARLQFVHPADALEVLRRAATGSSRGTYNAAGDGVLLLSQAARRAGKPTLPVAGFAAGLAGQFLRRAGGLNLSPELISLLTHGRVVDTSKLRDEFGYLPTYTTAQAFEEFVAGGPVVAGLGLVPTGKR